MTCRASWRVLLSVFSEWSKLFVEMLSALFKRTEASGVEELEPHDPEQARAMADQAFRLTSDPSARLSLRSHHALNHAGAQEHDEPGGCARRTEIAPHLVAIPADRLGRRRNVALPVDDQRRPPLVVECQRIRDPDRHLLPAVYASWLAITGTSGTSLSRTAATSATPSPRCTERAISAGSGPFSGAMPSSSSSSEALALSAPCLLVDLAREDLLDELVEDQAPLAAATDDR